VTCHLRTTPFHGRVAAANRGNEWHRRNGFTLAASYGDTCEEALAARAGVGVADISWHTRVLFEGARAGECLSRLLTRDAASLAPGESAPVAWLADGGGLRGQGVVARLARDSFFLVSAQADREWLARAASLFRVAAHDVTAAQGGLAIVGPYAGALLAGAGIAADVAPLAIHARRWRERNIFLSRWGQGFEIWCACEDAPSLWDALLDAGGRFAVRPMGLCALDVLDVEAGQVAAGRDLIPAREGDARTPCPHALGLAARIDAGHTAFNGHAAWLAARAKSGRALFGLEIESECLAPFAPVDANGRLVGHALSSVYSPALRRAIALAQLDTDHASVGDRVWLALPPTLGRTETVRVAATVARLPFLPIAAPIQPESAQRDFS
jgi:aminomethyltransferase